MTGKRNLLENFQPPFLLPLTVSLPSSSFSPLQPSIASLGKRFSDGEHGAGLSSSFLTVN
jgi:hypothetical protein